MTAALGAVHSVEEMAVSLALGRGLTPGKFNEAKGEGAVDQAIEGFEL